MKLQRYYQEIYAVRWFPDQETSVGVEKNIQVDKYPYGYYVDGVAIFPGDWIVLRLLCAGNDNNIELWDVEVWRDKQFKRANLHEAG